MADSEDATVKHLSNSISVVIGKTTVQVNVGYSCIDLREAGLIARSLNSIIEQSMSFIQHAMHPDHHKRDCLAEGFGLTPPSGDEGTDLANISDDMLKAMTDLPSA